MAKRVKIPRLCRHAPSGRGRVRLNGHDHYFGEWPGADRDPPDAVKEECDDLIGRWLAGGRKPLAPRPRRSEPAVETVPTPTLPAGPTVGELALRFLGHAETYYRDEEGQPTREVLNLRDALRPLIHLHGRTEAAAFGPVALREVRQLAIDGYEHPRYGAQSALCRSVINARVKRIRRMFRWGASQEIVPADIWHGLASVDPLKRGRTAAETKPVRPVAEGVMLATLPRLAPSAAAVVRLIWFTGARPGEAVLCRLGEIDRTGPVWVWKPRRHKNRWRGHKRSISVGENGKAVILEHVRIECPCCVVEGRPVRIGSRDGATCGPCADRNDEEEIAGPWPRREVHPPDECLFSPARDREERFEDRRASRKTKVQPSQVNRKKAQPRKAPGAHYTTQSLGQAVRTAAKAAGVESWSPNQCRHALATRARAELGIEHAAAAVGHAGLDTIEVYAARREGMNDEVAKRLG